MKILMINVVCGVRSTGRICTDLAEVLEQEGHEVKIAYGRFTVPREYDKYAVKIGNQMDFYIHAGASLLLDNVGLMSKKATKRFIEWAKEYNPDLIHLHNLPGYYVNIKELFEYLSNLNKPVIWTLHDCWSFTGHCCHYSANKCYKWQSECKNCKHLREYPPSLMWDNSNKNFELKKRLFNSVENMELVTTSNWLKNQVESSFLKNIKCRTIYNGIDTSVFKPSASSFKQTYNISDKKIILGVASIWSEKKGFNDFLELSKFIDSNYVIVLVGVSKKQKENLPYTIIAIERTDSVSELVNIYSAADVYVNTSVEETFGMTTLEAMACGTPVVVYDKTAVPEIVTEKVGFITQAGDINKLFNNVNKVLSGCIDRTACREYSLQFDKKILYQQYVNLYKEKQQTL